MVRTKLRYNVVKTVVPKLSVVSFKPALHSPRSPSRETLVPAIRGFCSFLVTALRRAPVGWVGSVSDRGEWT